MTLKEGWLLVTQTDKLETERRRHRMIVSFRFSVNFVFSFFAQIPQTILPLRSNNVKVIVRKRRQTQKYGKFLIFIFTTIIFSLFAKFSPVFWLGTLQSINSSHLVLWERISWINLKNHLFGLQTADKQNLHWSGFDNYIQAVNTYSLSPL